MTYFGLHFCGTTRIELCQTYFSHPYLEKPLISVRGKSTGAYHYSSGSFQWTPAVIALCMLFLTHKLALTSKLDHSFAVLIGPRGSLASTLDAILEKSPNWLSEMFGTLESGELLIKRLIKRSNPSHKFVGPTAVSLNPKVFQASNIEILLNNDVIETGQDLQVLLTKLNKSLPKYRAINTNAFLDIFDQESDSSYPTGSFAEPTKPRRHLRSELEQSGLPEQLHLPHLALK